jgi:hypothetical protein
VKGNPRDPMGLGRVVPSIRALPVERLGSDCRGAVNGKTGSNPPRARTVPALVARRTEEGGKVARRRVPIVRLASPSMSGPTAPPRPSLVMEGKGRVD